MQRRRRLAGNVWENGRDFFGTRWETVMQRGRVRKFEEVGAQKEDPRARRDHTTTTISRSL